MGKQAKLKKIRKSGQEESITQLPEENDRDRFIEQIEKQGYSFKQIQHAPEVPTKRTEPQV
ncbi:hypothetical protein HC931_10285 [Candidatus Gracilibacteria bacterium]|jgi:hypothetical protein|nr:hypothetical protein [Candidatus Gracilibacteria bacterium]NJM90071.1 hypothetical protein [Hydrococcus sp. RU_2_2]NJP20528.1 hypothetical protein [Hydrococcus sp. CRU_1_1]